MRIFPSLTSKNKTPTSVQASVAAIASLVNEVISWFLKPGLSSIGASGCTSGIFARFAFFDFADFLLLFRFAIIPSVFLWFQRVKYFPLLLKNKSQINLSKMIWKNIFGSIYKPQKSDKCRRSLELIHRWWIAWRQCSKAPTLAAKREVFFCDWIMLDWSHTAAALHEFKELNNIY